MADDTMDSNETLDADGVLRRSLLKAVAAVPLLAAMAARARSFYDGTAAQSCNHQQMLKNVKVPVLLTHHRRAVDPNTGTLIGAISDFQAQKVKELLESAGHTFEYVSLPDAAHAMHQADPERFVGVLRPWAMKLPT